METTGIAEKCALSIPETLNPKHLRTATLPCTSSRWSEAGKPRKMAGDHAFLLVPVGP